MALHEAAFGHLCTEIIRVRLGPGKVYYIHKAVAVQASNFLREKCASEPQSDEIALFGKDDDAFAILVHWMYYTVLPDMDNFNIKVALIKAYFLTDTLGMPKAKNHIIDAVRLYHRGQVLRTRWLELSLYESVQNLEQPLCQYFMDQLAYDMLTAPGQYLSHLQNDTCAKDPDFYENSVEVIAYVMRRLLANIRDLKAFNVVGNPAKKTGCVYHEHMEGEKCEAEGV